MSIAACIKNRCSTRSFQTEMIRSEELEQIIEAARMAPSGKNDRTGKIYVFRDSRILEELNLLLKDCIAAGGADEIPQEKGLLMTRNDYRFAYGAPVFLLMTDVKNGYNSFSNGGTMIENAMLQAAELGIGSCWINTVRRCEKDPAVQQFLQRYGFDPEKECVTGGIALGYPNGELQGKQQTAGNCVIYI